MKTVVVSVDRYQSRFGVLKKDFEVVTGVYAGKNGETSKHIGEQLARNVVGGKPSIEADESHVELRNH